MRLADVGIVPHPVKRTMTVDRESSGFLGAPPPPGVDQIPQTHRREHAGGPRPARDRRQLRDAKAPESRAVARAASAPPHALHDHAGVMAQRHRAFLPRPHRQAPSSRRRQERRATRRAILAYVDGRNGDWSAFVWTKTAERFFTERTDLDAVTAALQAAGWTVTTSEIDYVAKEPATLAPRGAQGSRGLPRGGRRPRRRTPHLHVAAVGRRRERIGGGLAGPPPPCGTWTQVGRTRGPRCTSRSCCRSRPARPCSSSSA